MHRSLPSTTAISLLSTITSAAFPNPEAITGTIPGVYNSTLDPGLIRRKFDGRYFLYATPNDLTVWTADSLHGPWTKAANTALYNYDESDLGPGNHGAPALYNVDDTYYLFYNGHDPNRPNNQNGLIGVATSPNLEPGSWDISACYLDIPWRKKYNVLDAALLPKDVSRGQKNHLLAFGSYQHGIYNIPLSDDLTGVPDGNDTENLAYNSTGRHDIEGSYEYYHDGYYYLFFSSGECCKRSGEAGSDPVNWVWPEDPGAVYKVMVCRSENPRGGFVDREGKSCENGNGGTMILGTHDNVWAPGGQGISANNDVGAVVLYYHYGECGSHKHAEKGAAVLTDGRIVLADQRNEQDIPYRFGWNKLDFSDGWPTLVAPA